MQRERKAGVYYDENNKLSYSRYYSFSISFSCDQEYGQG